MTAAHSWSLSSACRSTHCSSVMEARYAISGSASRPTGCRRVPALTLHDLDDLVSNQERRDGLLERSIEEGIQAAFLRIAGVRRNFSPLAENRSLDRARFDDRDMDPETLYFLRQRLARGYQCPF